MIDDSLIQNATILAIDDEEVNLVLLRRLLQQAGYHNLVTSDDPRRALALFWRHQPDLVLLDLHMPYLDGIAVIKQLQSEIPAGSYLPMVILTADISAEAEQQALASGAKDFLNKPFKATQILLRIRNLLETRFLHLALQQQNQELERNVEHRTRELEGARLEVLERLALAAEYRDYNTGQHTQRVGRLAEKIALRLGLPADEAALLRRAAPLHDVGKIGIPDNILLKPDKLSKAEFKVMEKHVRIGARLLSKGHSELIKTAELIALTHHERYDGSGYPRGLTGEEIPLIGQIVALADVFDTLVHERPYKQAWPLEKALAEIEAQRGHWFSPRVVDAFFEVAPEVPDPLEPNPSSP